jgi:hypothetical protein
MNHTGSATQLFAGADTATSIWRSPYDRYTDSALLRYYRSRRAVDFFPVADGEETRREKIDALLNNEFSFNGETYHLAEPLDWSINPSDDLEWHVLLHKFYYAVGLGMAYQASGDSRYLRCWVRLCDSWIAQAPADFCANPDLRIELPQVTGRRIQNWIYAYYYFVANAAGNPLAADFHRRFLQSLHAQVEYLCQHLSPARNHRTLELYAIFLAAVVFPEFRAASDWLAFAREQIVANMQSDLLDDGVHCELSTDYHHLVLKNYLCMRRLAQLNAIELPVVVDRLLSKALEFAMYVHKPDGSIPALSDADSQSFLDLLRQGYRLYGRTDMLYVATRGNVGTPPAERSVGFADSGYYIVRSGWGEQRDYRDEHYLIFDCGPLGQGNHGHLDVLSFELAAYGRSLIVDPGRYTYHEQGEINWRARFRGTAYHNTVQVDGTEQTRYGPKPGKARYKIQGPAPDYELKTFVQATHFDFLHGVARSHEYDALQQRLIFFVHPRYWIVADILQADRVHDYDLRFHLSEQAQGRVGINDTATTRLIDSPQLLLAQYAQEDIAAHIDDAYIAYRYGCKLPAPVVRFHQRARNAVFCTVLYPYRGQAPQLELDRLPLSTPAGEPVGDATALRIRSRHDDGDPVIDTCFFTHDACAHRYVLGDYGYDGRYLFMREDPQGRMIRLHTSDGATPTPLHR